MAPAPFKLTAWVVVDVGLDVAAVVVAVDVVDGCAVVQLARTAATATTAARGTNHFLVNFRKIVLLLVDLLSLMAWKRFFPFITIMGG